MSSVVNLQPDPVPLRACTIARDVQNFDILIDDMEDLLGERWGDLGFDDAVLFLDQPEASDLEFVAVVVDAEDEANLAPIAEVLRKAKARGLKSILIADRVSPGGLHQLLRMGADDFLPYPLPDGALSETVDKLRHQPAPAPAAAAQAAPAPQAVAAVAAATEVAVAAQEPHGGAQPAFRPKGDRNGIVLPVHGLAGGCGASTFAVNLAWELATSEPGQAAPRVCLLDLDFQFGSAATYLDLPRKESVFELLSDIENADSEALITTMLTFNEKLHVLTAPSDMLPLDLLSPDDIGKLIDMAQANFDFVVIDMPKTIVAWTEAVLNRATLYFAMVELDLRSAQNVLRLTRALKAEGLPHEKLRFVLNRAPRFTDLTAKGRVKRMAESLDISFEVQMPDGGGQVTQANDHGLPLGESAAKNALRKEIQKLAKSMVQLTKTTKAAAKA